ncbi:MAG TPA: hypothetical protein V6D28_23350 [Leptolyngbyaceae cyanobacterium]
MKTIDVSNIGKLVAISASSATLAWLSWQAFSFAQGRVICDRYGCYPADSYCDRDDCYPNFPVVPTHPKGFCPSSYPRAVLVEFIARGEDWANVWMDGNQVFQPRNFDRRKTLTLCPGAYRIIITGTSRFEVWASGYLDIGRTNIVRIAFSKDGGLEVSGDPYAWLPDDRNDPIDIWKRD